MNEIINNVFVNALRDAFNIECDNVFVEEHSFSERFEKRMNALIKRRNKPYYFIINTTRKRVACFALVLLMLLSATSLAFDGVRHAISDFLISVFDIHSIVEAREDYEAPETIEEIYRITYELDGYYEDVWSDTVDSVCVDYIKDNICISFCQYTKTSFSIDMNTEDTMVEKFQVNGFEAVYYVDNHGYHHIMWDNEDYIFYISSNTDKDLLVKIAESIKK